MATVNFVTFTAKQKPAMAIVTFVNFTPPGAPGCSHPLRCKARLAKRARTAWVAQAMQ